MTPSKDLRQQIYTKMLDVLISCAYEDSEGKLRHPGLCQCLRLARVKLLLIECPMRLSEYSELYEHKPLKVERGEYWFPVSSAEGFDKRVEIINKAINKLNFELC
jgi:hypothetical protein